MRKVFATSQSNYRRNHPLTNFLSTEKGTEIDNLTILLSIGSGAFLCGVAVMYIVMNRTWKKREAERTAA